MGTGKLLTIFLVGLFAGAVLLYFFSPEPAQQTADTGATSQQSASTSAATTEIGVAPYLVNCDGDLDPFADGPVCLVVDGEIFSGDIADFSYQPRTAYRLRVAETDSENYRLESVIEKDSISADLQQFICSPGEVLTLSFTEGVPESEPQTATLSVPSGESDELIFQPDATSTTYANETTNLLLADFGAQVRREGELVYEGCREQPYNVGLGREIPDSLHRYLTRLKTYENSRFGFSVAYAPYIFDEQRMSANNDGATFYHVTKASDEYAELVVSGSHNVLEEDFSTLAESQREEFTEITDETIRENKAIIRGVGPSGRQLVRVVILSGGDIFKLKLKYDAEYLPQKTAEEIINSFGPVSGA